MKNTPPFSAQVLNDRRKAYALLASLFGGAIDSRESAKSESSPYQDLHYDSLRRTANGGHVVALAHYYKCNGDSVPDPDMEILLDHQEQTADPLHFQNSLIFDVCVTDFECDGHETWNLKKHASQLSFLIGWLGNAKSQGHSFACETASETTATDE